MASQLNDITIIVNGVQVAYEADSLKWKDGFGEYNVRNAVVGGGQTLQVFSKDLSSKFGMVAFSMPSIPENEALKRAWKVNNNNNVVELVGPTGSGIAKIFTQASILNDPETNAATDGSIEVEFNTNPAQ
tara:strand:+ start:552 stop:941 length:390 start_codon:yes stop_codon:yes gene_type:complete